MRASARHTDRVRSHSLGVLQIHGHDGGRGSERFGVIEPDRPHLHLTIDAQYLGSILRGASRRTSARAASSIIFNQQATHGFSVMPRLCARTAYLYGVGYRSRAAVRACARERWDAVRLALSNVRRQTHTWPIWRVSPYFGWCRKDVPSTERRAHSSSRAACVRQRCTTLRPPAACIGGISRKLAQRL